MMAHFACLTSFPGFQNSLAYDSGLIFQVPIIEGRLRSSKHDHCLALFFLPCHGDGSEIESNDDQQKKSEWKKVYEFINELQKREEVRKGSSPFLLRFNLISPADLRH